MIDRELQAQLLSNQENLNSRQQKLLQVQSEREKIQYQLLENKHKLLIFNKRGVKQDIIKIFKKQLSEFKKLNILAKSNNSDYQIWLDENSPKDSDYDRMVKSLPSLKYKPVISIIMPVYNTPKFYLEEAIESVLNQIYPYWELCIADDASTKKDAIEIIQKYAALDRRIKVILRKENGHISRASNSALEIATGDFIALLDHDDLLTRDALYEIASALNQNPDTDMIYSDEDKIEDNGNLRDPFFKPDWCPDSLLSRMYVGHLAVYRRTLVREIEGFRVGYEGAQDYDLALRITEKTNKIVHIPKILYHWRVHSNSTASSLSTKDYATIAAQKAITEAIHRRNEPGKVVSVIGGHHIVRYKIKDYKLVSIIIPTKDLADTLDTCLSSIFEKTQYPNYEVILIDNGSVEDKTKELIARWSEKEPNRFRSYLLDIPFNYPKINNYGAERAKGEYLLFLNNDTEILTPDWLDAMVEQAQRPSIGAVGALLLYPDSTIQHAGVITGLGGVAGHSHKHYHRNCPGYFYQIQTVNNYSAVTAACLMCRREVFEEVEGLEEKLAVAFNDVDFCLKIKEKGYRNIYLPHVILYHYESKSRGYEDNPEKQARFSQEIKYMQNKWKTSLTIDSCYSKHLSHKTEDYSIAI